MRLPIVYNTGAYDSPDSLALMDGVVDASTCPDFKLWSSELARPYLAKRDYLDVARQQPARGAPAGPASWCSSTAWRVAA
jgi:putative pyruvate formate lyase activating enzyme